MSRRPAKVTQADVARVLRAWVQTGEKGRVVISPNGAIVIEPIPAEPDTAPWEKKPVAKAVEFTL